MRTTKLQCLTEHNEQVLLLKWFRFWAPLKGVDPRLLYAIPNGGLRNRVTAYSIKQEGAVAGVPDLFLAIPRGGKCGLYIEMKRAVGGKLSKDQKEMLPLLEAQGYAICLARGRANAIDAIKSYMGWGED